MILYATNLTYERLHIKSSETLHYAAENLYPQYDYINSVKKSENWSEIYEWYIELFYFSGNKYIRAVHLSSMFTLFFDGVNESFMYGLGFRIRNLLYKYFVSDEIMKKCLDLFFSDSFLNFYARINDKSRLSHYSLNQTSFNKSNILYKSHICGSKIDTVALNKAINTDFLFCDIHINKGIPFSSENEFKKQLYSIYSSKKSTNCNMRLKPNIELTQHERKIYS